jgi:predicted Ser/Thr protein kinase
MIDFKSAQVQRHRQNVKRYCRLLATELTDLERQYLHKRIAEEYAQLQQLEKATSRDSASADNRYDKMTSSCEPVT